MRRRWILAACVVVVGVAMLAVPRVAFLVGGAMVNLGYRLQDPQSDYDFTHAEDITPGEVWAEFSKQNALAASVREVFPRTVRHPVVALLVCMDARIDTNEITGDTRRDYYVLRTAGSVIAPEEEEMLELAVRNGVKLVVLTRHTDCAAEKATTDPLARGRFPNLVDKVEARRDEVRHFLARPFIAAQVANGKLEVREALIDTATGKLLPEPPDP